MGVITPSKRERTTAAENKRMIKKKIYSDRDSLISSTSSLMTSGT
jgi:hypothetical protein